MKTIFRINTIILFTCLLLNACKKDENKIYLQGGTAPVLTAQTSAEVIYVNAASPALTLSWTNPDYMFNTGVSSFDVSYKVEIDTAADFSNPAKATIAVSKELSHTFLVSELNDVMLNTLRLKADTAHTLQMRVISALVNNSNPFVSNTVQLTATPYTIPPKVTPPTSGELYITGNALASDWTNSPPQDQKFTKTSETLYEITVPLTGGNSYTFLPVYGSWDSKYSIAKKNDPDEVNGGTFQSQGNDILAPAASGNYKITVDFQRGVFTVTKL